MAVKQVFLATPNQNLLGRGSSRAHQKKPPRSKGLTATGLIIFYILILGEICILWKFQSN